MKVGNATGGKGATYGNNQESNLRNTQRLEKQENNFWGEKCWIHRDLTKDQPYEEPDAGKPQVRILWGAHDRKGCVYSTQCGRIKKRLEKLLKRNDLLFIWKNTQNTGTQAKRRSYHTASCRTFTYKIVSTSNRVFSRRKKTYLLPWTYTLLPSGSLV